MTFKVECNSILLQRALENFLEGYLDEDGLKISDNDDGDIIIGKDIKKPFSRSQLLLQLERVALKKLSEKREKQLPVNVADEQKLEFEIEMDSIDEFIVDSEEKLINKNSFEEKLDALIDEFSTKLKNLIKEHYDKK